MRWDEVVSLYVPSVFMSEESADEQDICSIPLGPCPLGVS